MRILTTTEYNEVCKSYEQFGSKLFDEMFLGYDDNSVSYLYNEDYYSAPKDDEIVVENSGRTYTFNTGGLVT